MGQRPTLTHLLATAALLVATSACRGVADAASLPLVVVSDVELPGGATRFDYQDVDIALGRLVIAHMNDGTVLFVDLRDGHVLKELSNIPTPRGVVVAPEVGLTFVTSSPDVLVVIDDRTMTEVRRVKTGRGPDGVGWDARDQIVAVSDQRDGALSLIASAGAGERKQVPLGDETGNVVFDAQRGWFWVTVVRGTGPDQLVAVSPIAARVERAIDLAGCVGAHGLRLHPDTKGAFIACEGNDLLMRVELDGAHAATSAPTGSGPDVLAIDPTLGWLYVAAEGGDLTVFDVARPGVALIGHDKPGASSHTVAVDPATHRVFFPLMKGPTGKPVLRIMRPTGSS